MRRKSLLSFIMLSLFINIMGAGGLYAQTTVSTAGELETAIQAGGEVTLEADITLSKMIAIFAEKTVILDLNGKAITVGYQIGSTDKHLYPFDVYGNLTIKDSKGNGSVTGRGIYVQYGSTITIDGGSIYGIDSNGGSALFQYGGDIVINGGHVEQKAAGTYNFAINADAGTVTVNGGWVGGNHGAIAAVGAAVVINDGEFVCTGTAGMTDNVLYTYGEGSITIKGGTFTADNDGPSGGTCVYDANGRATINGGTFGNSSGGDVWGIKGGTEINGGTFENLIETSHVTVGATIVNGGKTYTKTESGEMEETGVAVAKVNNTNYATLEEAIMAAAPNGTVEILSDVTVDEWIMFSETLNIGSGQIITINIDDLTIDGNGKTVTIKDIESAGNGNRLFYDATELNVKDLTIECVEDAVNAGGIGLTSGTIENVTFIGGGPAVYPGTGEVIVTGCTFKTNGTSIYYEEERNSLVVDNNTFENSSDVNAILLRGNTTFTNNNVLSGRTVNVVSGSPVVTGNNFNNVRFKVYNAATATISGNTINNLVFNDESVVFSTFGENTLNTEAQAVLDGASFPVAQIGTTKYGTLQEAVAAAQTGDVVKVFAGEYKLPSMKAGITIEGAVDENGKVQVLFEGTLTGTLENLTLKNIHIKGGNAQRWAYAKGDLTFVNVIFEATSVYALHFDGITEGTNLLYENCTIIGWAAMGGTPESCKFIGCTIKDNGTYGVIRTYFDTTIEECTFDVDGANHNDNYQDGIHAVEGAYVEVKECTNVNGTMEDIVNIQAMSVVSIDGVEIKHLAKIGDNYYFTLAEAFAAAQNGETVQLLADLTLDSETTYTIADGKSVTLDMNGKKITVTDNKTNGDEIKNYELFYIYGGMTVTGDGTIELTATNDRDWNAMSAIFHNRGGVLTINNGTFKHLGGTDMAYVVDNSGNWYGDATTNINNGTLASTYIAIRNRMEQNTHGASGKAILNVTNGSISGTSRAIWAQAASTSETAPATGEINISGGTINGLIDTPRSTGAQSMTTISGGTVAAFKGESGELKVTGEGKITGDITIMNAAGEQVEYMVVNGLYVGKTSAEASGTWGGIDWTLTYEGTLIIAPTAGTPGTDNYGRSYEVGQWPEAVRYNSNGVGVAVEGWPYDRTKVKTLIIKEGVISIGSFTAQSFTNLTGEVVIPYTVNYIGQEAFQKSTMTTLTFAPVPEGETGEELCIAQGAFKNLIIEEVSLPADRPVHLHAWVFNNCHNLKNVTIPATVVSFHGTNHIDYFEDFNQHSNPTWTHSSEIFAYNENMETVEFGSEEVMKQFYLLDNGTNKDYLKANVGLVTYCDVDDAIVAAKNGGTITLVKNTNAGGDNKLNIPADANITIDLKDRNMTCSILAPNANLTVKNGTITNNDASVSAIEINKGTLTIENVNVNSARHALRIDGEVTATINGGTYKAAQGSGTGTYHAANISGAANVTIEDGTFVGPKGTSADSGSAVNVQSGAKVTIEGGDFSGGKNATLGVSGTMIVKGGTFDQDVTAHCAEGYLCELNDETGKYEVFRGLAGEGTEANPYLITDADELHLFRKSVNAGETRYNTSDVWVVLNADIDLDVTRSASNWEPIGTFDYSFDGNFDGKGHIIKNLKIYDNTTAANGEAYLGFFGVTANNTIKNFVIENVTIESEGQIVAAAIAYPFYTEVSDITVKGDIKIKGGNYTAGVLAYTRLCQKASNLTVSGNEDSYIEGAQTVGGVIADIQMNHGLVANYSNFTAEGLTIKGTKSVGGISGIIAGQTLNTCSVKNVTLACNDARVGIVSGSLGAPSTISNATYENVTGATNIIGATYDGAKPIAAKIGDTYYGTLQLALNAAVAGTGNITVEILEDINLTNVDWNPVTVSAPGFPVVTVEGNNKTITGLNDMLFAGTWAGGSGLIINDLTIANSNIVNDKDDTQGTVGVGAFIGYPQASATITLNNCHLKDSHVEGGHWTGGLIGMAGGYNGNDGPVFMNLTIEGCSVTGSTITGKGSCGGIIGHGSCAAWTALNIKETTVSGNTITSTGTSYNKAGAIMGTIGAAGQPTTANGVTLTGGAMVAATVSDNTVTSGGTAITTIYGRQGTNTGILELNGGTYDKYPIEENVAYAKPAAGLMIELNEYGTYGLVEDPAYGKVAMIGETYYETLSAAFAAVTNDEQTVVILSDVTEKLEDAYLRGNITTKDGTEVTITLTNQDWVYCPYTFILGENITLNVPALFYYAGGAQINGTVVAGAYYQRYANTKLTINEPGSMKVTTETFIVRYMDADPNAGIYIIGDNNDETIGLDASVIYFYQGMINAKNADIKVGTYWQTNETDNEGSANLVLDNSNMTVTVNEHNMKATANSTVTLTNGSNVTVAGGYQGVGVSIDATSSMTMARSIFVSKINNYHYTSLQEAVNVGGEVTVLQDITLTEGIVIPADKIVTLDLAGYTVSQTKEQTAGYQMILNDGTLTIKDSSDEKTGKLSYTDSGNGGEYISDVIYNRSVLVIDGGTIENLSSATVATNGYPHAVDTYSGIRNTSVTINGGTIYCAEYSAIRMFCVSATYTADLVINEGAIVKGAIDMQNGTLAAALGTLTINGGTFETTKNANNIRFANWNGGATEYGITASVTGGRFNGGITTQYVPAEADFNIHFITGGTFATDVNKYCHEYYDAIQGDDNLWRVEQVLFTQTTALQGGWNWFSSYVDLSTPNGLEKIQKALGTNGEQIKTQGSQFSFYQNNQWNSSQGFTSLYNDKMYMIKTTSDVSAEIIGSTIDYANTVIVLNKGWNWISYPLSVSTDVNEALEGMSPAHGDVIKGYDDNSTSVYYLSDDPQTPSVWWPAITLEPGHGYMYKSETNSSFRYTAGDGTSAKANSRDNNYWVSAKSQYANNMTMIAMLSVDNEIVKGDYEIAAFANGECRGSARPIYNEHLDAYVLLLTVYGDEVEELTFKYYDVNYGTEYELSNRINYSNDAVVGSIDEPYMFNLDILNIGETSVENISIYPNPTTTGSEINLQAVCDKVEVFNALGVKVAEYTNVDSIDAIETAGVYVIRLTIDNSARNCRLIVK